MCVGGMEAVGLVFFLWPLISLKEKCPVFFCRDKELKHDIPWFPPDYIMLFTLKIQT